MLRHLFKLLWNKKKQNFLLISEMFVSFLVMFAVFTLMVLYYRNYLQPLGMDHEDVWVANFTPAQDMTNLQISVQKNAEIPVKLLEESRADSLAMFFRNLKRDLLALPEINGVSFSSSNIPFSHNTTNTSISNNGERVSQVNVFQVDKDYRSALNFRMLEGRWFEESDVPGSKKKIVINKMLKEKLFGSAQAEGRTILDGEGKNKLLVIGVADDLKIDGSYDALEYGMYEKIETPGYQWLGNMLIRVTPDADAAFEARLYKKIAATLKGANIEIEHLDNKLTAMNRSLLVPLIILLVVATFLIVNVALGLFGVLWYNINKRRGEIGLRRAVGATGSSISAQLVTEAIILATFSIVLGSFFAIQFPLLNVFDLPAAVYLIAQLFSIVFIYAVVLLCSLYPGKQAAAVYPAFALKEE